MSRLTARLLRRGQRVEVGHDCVDGWRTTTLHCPPWRVLTADPLTIDPAITCPVTDCGLQVRVTADRIVPVTGPPPFGGTCDPRTATVTGDPGGR